MKMTAANGDSLYQSADFDDTWVEYGIGAAIRTGHNNHLYFDVERTAGSDFKKDWQWNIGALGILTKYSQSKNTPLQRSIFYERRTCFVIKCCYNNKDRGKGYDFGIGGDYS